MNGSLVAEIKQALRIVIVCIGAALTVGLFLKPV